MKHDGEGTKSARRAAGCFAAAFAYTLATQAGQIGGDSPAGTAGRVLGWIGLAGLGAAAFLKNKRAFAAAAGIMCAACFGAAYGRMTVMALALTAAYAMLALAALLSEKGNEIARKMWFIPGVLRMTQIVYVPGREHFSLGKMSAGEWAAAAFIAIETAAVFFAGRWLGKKEKNGERNG